MIAVVTVVTIDETVSRLVRSGEEWSTCRA